MMEDLLCPNYEVTVGSDKFSPENVGLISLRVARNIGIPIDISRIQLVPSEDYTFKKGDSLKVKLGYDDKLEPAFSGLINDIEHELSAIKVTALGLAVNLLRLRLNRVYLSQTAGKIITNIAQEAKINVKKASDGINLPTYVIDDTTNAYEHILRLAESCNFNVFMTDDDKLVFQEHGSSKSTPLYYGREIMSIQEADFSPMFSGTKVCGESPSSIKGSDTCHWLTKQEVKGQAGNQTILVMQDPTIKDSKTADTVAKAKTAHFESTTGFFVETVGVPEIKLGDSVTLENLPDSKSTGKLEVTNFEHYLSKTKGFTTRINCLGGSKP